MFISVIQQKLNVITENYHFRNAISTVGADLLKNHHDYIVGEDLLKNHHDYVHQKQKNDSYFEEYLENSRRVVYSWESAIQDAKNEYNSCSNEVLDDIETLRENENEKFLMI